MTLAGLIVALAFAYLVGCGAVSVVFERELKHDRRWRNNATREFPKSRWIWAPWVAGLVIAVVLAALFFAIYGAFLLLDSVRLF